MRNKIIEWNNVTKEKFHEEIIPLYQPAILKGFSEKWMLVKKSKQSNLELSNYIKSFDNGAQVETFIGDESIDGRFFYNEDLTGYNFQRIKESISFSLDRILNNLSESTAPSLYTGSVPIINHGEKFLQQNKFNLITQPSNPRIWVGNKVTIQAHFDQSDNVACVVAGRRRFTLFSPEQISNMYVGPIDNTVAGPQLSMVNISNPDYNKHPKFKQAMGSAMVAELSPGDAIYIPSLWWHHVESLEEFNVLVNYWWATHYGSDSPLTTLVHALLSLRNLSDGERKAWQALFNHYIFNTEGNPVGHLPEVQQGVLGELTEKTYPMIKNHLMALIKSQLH